MDAVMASVLESVTGSGIVVNAIAISIGKGLGIPGLIKVEQIAQVAEAIALSHKAEEILGCMIVADGASIGCDLDFSSLQGKDGDLLDGGRSLN
jgi:hypothetical protein